MKTTKSKLRSDDNEEPIARKVTRLTRIDEGAVLCIEEEAEHDKAECSDEERIRQEEENEESEAETEIVPPSLDGDEFDDAYRPEAPMTADEYMDALLKAADASKLFKETFFPALKQRIVKVRKYKLPWYDEPACTNERFCIDNSCDSSNRYPAWAWCVMRCEVSRNIHNDGKVAITFEPVSRRIYVMVDSLRFGTPIPLQQEAEVDVAVSVNRVVFEVRKKLEQVAAAKGKFHDIDDDE